ncbi:MAG: 23S rRNA (uracil(1939)-C(5))-methyltransferase RlmD [Porcipelethomonas sp.]
MKKNQIITAEITDITNEGNGVCRFEGMAVFVPETAVGDTAEIKIVKLLKNYAYGIVSRILVPSPDRIVPDCPLFPKCGGCSFRHISYEAELKIKEKFVRDAFARIGGLTPEFLPVIGCENPDRYRNKAQYPVGEENGTAVCGFYAKRSHRIIKGSDCRLLPEIFSNITETVMEYVHTNNIRLYNEADGKGTLRHIYLRLAPKTHEIMVCLIVKKDCREKLGELCSILTEKFPDIKSIVMNINPENTNVILGKKTVTLSGKRKICDTLCSNKINIAPEAFYQINSPQAERLYRKAEEFAGLTGNENLIDLYCGAGTIGLSMASSVKHLTGIEIVPQAIENAKENAQQSGIKNADFICSDAGKAAVKLLESGTKPDVVILDPPRKGCDTAAIEAVSRMSPEKIIMISCNPATAARDCAVFEQNGYKTVKVQSCDLFPRTTHVECVVLMSRVKD